VKLTAEFRLVLKLKISVAVILTPPPPHLHVALALLPFVLRHIALTPFASLQHFLICAPHFRFNAQPLFFIGNIVFHLRFCI